MHILTKLKKAPGRLAKESLLREFFKDASPTELKVFEYALNPDIVFGLKAVGRIDWNQLGPASAKLFNLLDKLKDRKLTGSQAQREVLDFARAHGHLIKLILSKKLDCGVTAKTINKIRPGTVNVGFAKKAMKATEATSKLMRFPLEAQIKFDGVRLLIVKEQGSTTFYTYNGKKVRLPRTKELVDRCKYFDNGILDCEVTLATGKMIDRSRISGMINSAMHGGAINETVLVFNAFDYLHIDEWHKEECKKTFVTRNHIVKDICIHLDDFAQFKAADSLRVRNETEVLQMYEHAISLGYEGLVLKHPSHLYEFKRSKSWLKMKEVKTADLLCTGITDGTGKYAGMIGALECEGFVEGKKIYVSVGSGLTDADRSLGKDHYIGCTIEVKYNSVVQDKVTKIHKLFLPRFVMRRFDK